ncbi:MAG: hemolysin family protein, partial [Bacteroidota bacterium]|nr:hemolysin family protein [Bacteroidota bacterium]
ERKKGGLISRIIAFYDKKPNKYIATMLLGNNAALVIYGLIMAIILEPKINQFISSEFWTLIIQTLVSTILILFAAEFIPKTLFRINPNRTMHIFAFPSFVIYLLFFPLTMFTITLSNFFLKYIIKADISDTEGTNVFGKTDLNNYIEKYNKNFNEIEEEIKIIQNTLDFAKIRLKECIVPRNEIVALDVHSSFSDLTSLISQTGYSKIAIYERTIDNIIGYVHVHSLFQDVKSLKDITVKIPIVPESMTAQKLFNKLVKNKSNMALVVDEYGGTSGIVTIEDILEEIFGEIEDEHDIVEIESEQIDENSYVFSGRLEIDRINEKYSLNIPVSDEYETMAGFIIQILERFPEKDEKIIFENFEITILKAEQPKIDSVKFVRKIED